MTQASSSKQGQDAYKQALYQRISTCSHCKNNLSFCGGCKKYVQRFLETNEGVARSWNKRKEEIFRHIKKKLDAKDFVVGVGDELEASILDVLKYLSAKEAESSAHMAARALEFRRREKAFADRLTSEIYDSIDLDEHTDGVNMFKDPAVVDPFFEKNVITDWVVVGKARDLFIPEKMHHPWTGDGGKKKVEVNELPKKRQAGQTLFPGEGVRKFEKIYV